MMPLGLLSDGEKAEIAAVGPAALPREARDAHARAGDMGLRVGKRVEMLSNGGKGSVLVRVDDTRIAIDRGVAMRITVRRS